MEKFISPTNKFVIPNELHNYIRKYSSCRSIRILHTLNKNYSNIYPYSFSVQQKILVEGLGFLGGDKYCTLVYHYVLSNRRVINERNLIVIIKNINDEKVNTRCRDFRVLMSTYTPLILKLVSRYSKCYPIIRGPLLDLIFNGPVLPSLELSKLGSICNPDYMTEYRHYNKVVDSLISKILYWSSRWLQSTYFYTVDDVNKLYNNTFNLKWINNDKYNLKYTYETKNFP